MWTGFWEWHRTLIPKLPKKILHFFFYPTSLYLIERMKKWRRWKIYRGQKRFFLFFFSHLCLAKRIEKWNDGKWIKFSFVGCKERNSNLHKVQYIYIYITSSIFLPFSTKFWRQENGGLHGKFSTSPFSFPFLLQPKEGKGMSQFKSNQILFTESKENRGKFKQLKENKWYTEN